jgi:hypothetical protein
MIYLIQKNSANLWSGIAPVGIGRGTGCGGMRAKYTMIDSELEKTDVDTFPAGCNQHHVSMHVSTGRHHLRPELLVGLRSSEPCEECLSVVLLQR